MKAVVCGRPLLIHFTEEIVESNHAIHYDNVEQKKADYYVKHTETIAEGNKESQQSCRQACR
jgi:hypothetical protein